MILIHLNTVCICIRIPWYTPTILQTITYFYHIVNLHVRYIDLDCCEYLPNKHQSFTLWYPTKSMPSHKSLAHDPGTCLGPKTIWMCIFEKPKRSWGKLHYTLLLYCSWIKMPVTLLTLFVPFCEEMKNRWRDDTAVRHTVFIKWYSMNHP